MKIKIEKPILILAAIGLLARIGFILFVAKGYFSRENIFEDGDTSGWQTAIENLINHGTYMSSPYLEYSQFTRMPGYSFFIGIFYLLSGKNWDIAVPIIGWTQTLIDFFVIILIYKTAMRIFKKASVSFLIAVLYTFYPFVIVWTPVVYSEYMSIVLMVLFLYFFFAPKKNQFGWSGLILGLAVLFRPQFLLIIPAVGLVLLLLLKPGKLFLKKALVFSGFFLLAYAPWPLRNYFLQDKLILTQDLRGVYNWEDDVLSFMQYIYSVKAEWDPQFTQIIHNKKVEWPAESYLNKEDSAKLERVAYLSQNCGGGFSSWHGYWQAPIWGANCNVEIKKIYDELREEQMQKNPFNFWVKVPMQNLQKALLKVKLSDTSTMIRKIASLLFLYRTILLLLGIAGLFFMLRAAGDVKYAGVLAALFFATVYITLCFGTSPQMRNIEMRYFLQPDILMLFPAAFLLDRFFGKYYSKWFGISKLSNEVA